METSPDLKKWWSKNHKKPISHEDFLKMFDFSVNCKPYFAMQVRMPPAFFLLCL
jgi:hypothetical protein